MASPFGGRSTGAPPAPKELVSHAVPLVTGTACATPARLVTCSTNPFGGGPYVHASMVVGPVGRTIGSGELVGAVVLGRIPGWGLPRAERPITPPMAMPTTNA